MKTCSTCKYWIIRSKTKSEEFACHRYPPKTEILEDSKGNRVIVTIWPLTAATDFCGEHKDRMENASEHTSGITDSW